MYMSQLRACACCVIKQLVGALTFTMLPKYKDFYLFQD